MKLDLLDKIDKQNQLIQKQHEIICKLLNENVEQETFINEFLKEETECTH